MNRKQYTDILTEQAKKITVPMKWRWVTLWTTFWSFGA